MGGLDSSKEYAQRLVNEAIARQVVKAKYTAQLAKVVTKTGHTTHPGRGSGGPQKMGGSPTHTPQQQFYRKSSWGTPASAGWGTPRPSASSSSFGSRPQASSSSGPGPKGGCHICSGPHYAKDCPRCLSIESRPIPRTGGYWRARREAEEGWKTGTELLEQLQLSATSPPKQSARPAPKQSARSPTPEDDWGLS